MKAKNLKTPRSGKFRVQTLTGMHDYLPAESKYWEAIQQTVRDLVRAYGFGPIITPVVEQAELIFRSLGGTTDVVEKETYTFTDQSGESITLRPEFTAGIARSYIEHGMVNLPQPVKLWTYGPCFRHEKPQSGRYRQFFQYDLETIGSDLPVVDAELILISQSMLRELGLPSELQINSIGNRESRSAYYEILNNYLKTRRKGLCADCQKRLTKNPLRLFDCKETQCQEILAEAPQMVDHLDDDSREHFVKVLEHLDEAEVSYTLNPKLVRGLDYYTRTVFEFLSPKDSEKRMNTLIAGGRYDGLIEYMGGRPTPACGFAVGVERLILSLKENNVPIKSTDQTAADVFLAQIGESARKRSLKLFEDLRRSGINVVGELIKQGLKTQLSMASKLNVGYTLILGQKEIVDKTIILRDMENSSQEIINYEKIIPELQKRLARKPKGAAKKPIDPVESVTDIADASVTPEAKTFSSPTS